MSNAETYRSAYRRAIISGNDKVANEAKKFLLREYKRQGLDYGAALNVTSRITNEALKARDTGVIGNFFKGMGAGAVGLGQTAALGAAALYEEEEEQKAREKIQDFFGDYMPSGYNEDSMVSKVGSGIGSIAALAPAALLGKYGLPAAGIVSLAAGAGEASERARAEGATEDQRNTAALQGTLVGLSEVITPAKLFRGFRNAKVDKVLNAFDAKEIKNIGDRAQNIFTTAGIEGLQEFSAAVAQNAIERGYNPDRALVDGQTTEEGTVGAIAGGILQGFMDTIAPRNRVASTNNTQTTQGETTPTTTPAAEVQPVAPQPDDQQVRDELLDAFGDNPDAMAQQMAGVTDEQVAGIGEQQDMFPEAIQDAEEARLAQEDLIAGADTQQPTQFTAQEIEAAVNELAPMDSQGNRTVDPATLTQDDVMTMAELLRESNQPQQRSPLGATKTPQQPDLFEEQRRAQERAENDKRNEALVSGEQQDMFAREKGQGLAGLLQRRGQQSRAQQEEIAAAQEEAQLADLFDEEAAALQGELDLQGLNAQPARGQMDMFLNEPQQTPPEGDPTLTIPQQERPEPPTNEPNPQLPLADRTDYQTAGINRPRNQRNRVRKELARGQEQRERKKNRGNAPQAQQSVVETNETPTQQPNVRAPEEVGVSPVATAVQQGRPADANNVQGPVFDSNATPPAPKPKQETDAPQYAGESVRKLKRTYSRPQLEAMLEGMGNTTVKDETTEDLAKRIVAQDAYDKAKGKKPAEKANEAKPTNTGDKASPAKMESGPKAPEYKGETYAELMRNYNQSGLRMMARKMGLPASSTTPKQTLASSIIKAPKPAKKPAEKKPVENKKTTTPAKKLESKPTTDQKKARNVKTERKGAKNKVVEITTAPPTPSRTESDIADAALNVAKSKGTEARRKDRPMQALHDYMFKHGGLDQIAYDLAREGKVKDRRISDDDLVDTIDPDGPFPEAKAKELRKQGIAIDKRTWGTTVEKAKRAMEALEAAGEKDAIAYIKRRMGEADIGMAVRAQARAESMVDESGKTASESEILEKKDLQRSIAARKNDMADKRDELADLEAIKKKSTAEKAQIEDVKRQIEGLKGIIKAAEDRIAQIDKEAKNLPTEALLESEQPLTLNVITALMRGRLQQALIGLQESIESPRLKQIAKLLADNVGGTKIVVMENLTTSDGTDVAGYFDPKTNTIYLDANDGMNNHTLMHEMLHAVTSATLANKSNATTKQLEKLFEDVKGKLGTSYGATNLDEFIAEAFSNPEFRKLLSRITADGSKIRAWERFGNIIMNMVRTLRGLETKKLDSAMSELDTLIGSIIHPAPTSRMAEQLPMIADSVPRVEAELSRVAKADQAAQNKVDSRVKLGEGIINFATAVPEKVQMVFNKVLQMQGLADLAQYYGYGDIGHRFLRAFNSYRGAQERMDVKVQQGLQKLGKQRNALPEEQIQLVDAFIYDENYGATISQVDILDTSRGESSYKDPAQREAYQWLKEQWDKMTPEAKQLYKDSRKFFLDQRTEVEQMLEKRIDQALIQGEQGDNLSLRNKLTKQLIEDTRLAVYFPLVRDGDYVVAYDALDDSGAYTEVVRQFEGEREQRLFAEAIKNEQGVSADSVRSYRRSNQAPSMKDIPPTSFMHDILKQLKGSGVPEDAISDIVDVYINTLPESAMAKAYKKRKGTAGYVRDLNYALNRKGYQTGQQIVRLQHVREIGALKTELAATQESVQKTGKGSAKARIQVGDELAKRADFVLNGADNKSIENVVKNLNQGAFVFTIGFNVASAIVNLSQVPMVVFPMLAGRYTSGDAQKELMKASGLVFGSSRKNREGSGFGKASASASIAYGIDNYFDITANKDGGYDIALRKDLDLPKERMDQLKAIEDMVLEASLQGQLTSSFLAEALGLEEQGKQTEAGWFNTLTSLSAGMFSQAERFNRQVTLIASYNLEYKRRYDALRKDGVSDAKAIAQARKEAAQFSIEYTQRLNGGSTLETASGLSQQGIGRIALMYKNYGIQMYTMMFQTALQATTNMFDGNPEKRLQARRQLIGLHGSALFFSGVYGMPLYGTVSMLWDLMVTDEDEDDFDAIVQANMSQGMFRGGVNALLEGLGADVDAGIRMRMTDLILQENKFNPNPSAEEQIGGLVGGVALSIGKRLQRGFNDVSEGNYQRGLEQLLPAALSNVIKPLRYAEEDGIRTRRYDLIHDDLSAGEIAAQVIGFAPEQYLRQQEQNRRVKNISEAINKKATALTKAYYVATRRGDYGALRKIMQDINEYNRRNPKFMIDMDRLNKSLQGHVRTTERMYNGVSISKRMQDYLNEFNENIDDTLVFPNR